MKSNKKIALKQLGTIAIVLLALNFVGNYFFKRIDLTQDKRYTLSEATLNIIKNVTEPLYIDVFLEGNFPPEFKRLQNETRQLLEEFSAYNSNIIFEFANPIEKESERYQIMQQFYENGLTPLNITVEDKGKQTQEVVFPWAVATYKEKDSKIGLLKNLMGASTEDKIISSVQHLEYAFADGLNKIVKEKQKKIAIIKGNGELEDKYIADFLRSIKESYFIAPFTLDSVTNKPLETLKALEKYDLAIIAKPTEVFTEAEKQVLDQYIVNGGNSMWLIDAVKADMDSLYNETGSILAYPQDLNLTDQFFKYGIRLNNLLIKDELATPLILESGQEGSNAQKEQFLWKYAPFVYPASNHPIVKNIEGVKFEFTNPIEILKNKGIQKTILLSSSEKSKPVGTPVEVSLKMVLDEVNETDYQGKGFIPVAVLLEGKFRSAYENRILPFQDSSFKNQNKSSKIVMISDGDIIKNQLNKNGTPIELGFDKFTQNLFGNKEFLMNCTNYLLDDTGLMKIRAKEVNLPLLDKEKVHNNYTQVQMITIGLPLVVLALFGFVFTYLRKRKYSILRS